MNTDAFLTLFRSEFSQREIDEPTTTFTDAIPEINGMVSPKGQRLVNLACRVLTHTEAYLEVGCWHGKMLLSAARSNPGRTYLACDNFVHFTKDPDRTRRILRRNVKAYLPRNSKYRFFEQDFRTMFRDWQSGPIGVYVYDAAHDRKSQRDGLVLAEPHLSDEALVLVDDWRMPGAREGTQDAIAASSNQWDTLLELPTRDNGDLEMWWNGMMVLRFRRGEKA